MSTRKDTVLYKKVGRAELYPIFSCAFDDPDKDDLIADIKSDYRRAAREAGIPKIRFVVVEGGMIPDPVPEPIPVPPPEPLPEPA